MSDIDPLHILIALCVLAILIGAAVGVWLGTVLSRPTSPVDEFLADAPGDVPHISEFDRASLATRIGRAFAR